MPQSTDLFRPSLGFRVQRYGMLQWGDLFTVRQEAALMDIGRLADRGKNQSPSDALRQCLALAQAKVADNCSSLGSWILPIPMVWDFAEANATSLWTAHVEWVAKVSRQQVDSEVGQIQTADAIAHPLHRIHRCGAALGLEQGVRAVGRDGPRSIPINGAGGGLWLSLGAPMAVLGSGTGAGSAGQHAGGRQSRTGPMRLYGAVG